MATSDNPFAPSKMAPDEFDAKELSAPGAVCFRVRKSYWIAAICCAGIVAASWAILLFIDSPKNTQSEDIGPTEWIVYCTMLTIFSLGSFTWFLRMRLWFTPRLIVYRGLFMQAICNQDVNKIVWCMNQLGAAIEIHGPYRLIKIRLESYEWKDQNAIVAAIRRTFPEAIQLGWNYAFERRLSYIT
jgi:hypothetical protein